MNALLDRQRSHAAAAAPDDDLDCRRLAGVAAQTVPLRWQIVTLVTVIAAVLWNRVPWPAVAAWAGLAIGVRELRARRLVALVADDAAPIARRLRQLVGWNIVLGSVNGSAAFFLPWLDTAYDAVLTMILVSWAAGAVSMSALLLRAYTAYAACVFTPLAAMWLARGTPLGVGVAGLTALFAGVQYKFAKHNAAVFEESFRIRRENEQLVRELAAARDAAETANRAKTRFLAVASHDLRQPLHALTLHSGLLAMDPLARDAPVIAREMSASIDSLAKLLDSLLDISKLDAGVVVVEPRPIRLQRLLALLVRNHAPLAAAKGIALRVECPSDAVVNTDALLLERLLRNLIDNAVKYTDRGEVEVLVTGTDEFRIAVRDTGCGIPAPALPKVFDEFYQVAAPEKAQGLGLGLAIARRLATMLDLGLELQSEPGRGTTIAVCIPNAGGHVAEAGRESAAGTDLAGRRILLIDDEASVRRATRRALERFGCEVDEAAGGDEAVALARTRAPDVVLADIRLGGGDDGIAAVGRLRELLPGLPAWLITGDIDAERLREAERSGLPLLHKPVTLPQLRAALRAALAPQAAAQE